MPTEVSTAFRQPALDFATRETPLLRAQMTVEEALRMIREHGVEERIIYFYVTDAEERLAGVLPTRRLLTAPLTARLEEVMVRRVLAIPQTASLLEACELFVLHKFLAFPIVDEQRKVLGIIDIAVFTEEMLELPEEPKGPDEVFEAIGIHLERLKGASPARAFRYRFPWLLTTISSGTIAALVAGSYEGTLGAKRDHRLFSGARPGPRGGGEYSVDDPHASGATHEPPDVELVCHGGPARDADRATPGAGERSLGFCGGVGVARFGDLRGRDRGDRLSDR